MSEQSIEAFARRWATFERAWKVLHSMKARARTLGETVMEASIRPYPGGIFSVCLSTDRRTTCVAVQPEGEAHGRCGQAGRPLGGVLAAQGAVLRPREPGAADARRREDAQGRAQALRQLPVLHVPASQRAEGVQPAVRGV